MPTLTELAEQALILAKRLDSYTISQGLQPVSLKQDTLSSSELPRELHDARNQLGDIAQIIRRQTNDPVRNLMETMFSFTDLASLNIVCQYDLPSKIPLEPPDKTVSTAEIARESGIPEGICRRALVHAMENGIFIDAGNNQIAHSPISRLLASDPSALQTVTLLLDEFVPAALHIPDALRKYGSSGEPTETAYNMANKTSLPMYEFLKERPGSLSRFGAMMGFLSSAEGFDIQYLVDGFSWEAIDRSDAIAVDIGGGVGVVSQKLAEATKNIKFVVQDLATPVKLGREKLLSAMPAWRNRIQFMVTDFLEQDQPIVGADVYLFRWVLHNWSDEYCVRILRRLAPAMRAHSKVVVYEYLLADGPEFKWSRKHGRNLDMIMHSCWNGSERTQADFTRIFNQADERYVLEGVSLPDGSAMSIVSFGWDDRGKSAEAMNRILLSSEIRGKSPVAHMKMQD